MNEQIITWTILTFFVVLTTFNPVNKRLNNAMNRQEGFPGQRSFVIPQATLDKVLPNPLINDLYVTDIGYYPNARHHYRERPEGIAQAILMYNVEGYGTVRLAGEEYSLPPDHFIIIPPHTPHVYYAANHHPWSIYWIHLEGKKTTHMSLVYTRPTGINRQNVARYNERLELFNELFRSLEKGISLEILEYVNLCLPRLLATFIHHQQYGSLNQPMAHDAVSTTIELMQHNLHKPLALAELAAKVHLSVSYFARLFAKKTGFPPIAYFNQLKIQHACRLLDNQELSIAEVAREVGFDDQFYFSRTFKQLMHCSPRAYRQGNTGD